MSIKPHKSRNAGVHERERERDRVRERVTVSSKSSVGHSTRGSHQSRLKKPVWYHMRELQGNAQSWDAGCWMTLRFSFNRISFILSLLHRKWWICVYRKVPFILTKYTSGWTKNGHKFISLLWNLPPDTSRTAYLVWSRFSAKRLTAWKFQTVEKLQKGFGAHRLN